MTRKTPEAIAINAMRSKDLAPLEPFTGGSKPWKCRCLKCGQTVFPRYASIRRGQGGCVFCAGKVSTTQSQAFEIISSAGLKPLEPYPGAKVGWRAECLNCGKISSPRIDTLKNRKSKCRFCSAKERGLKGRLTQDQAFKIAQASKLKPLEPYKNSQTKWKCECLKCGSIVYPMLTSLKRGQGGCLQCGYAESKKKQSLPEAEAIEFFLSKGFKPLVPYPGANRPWKSKCTKCGEITAPHLNRVRSGTGCGVCAGRIVPEHKAIENMRNSKLEPLSPYPGGKKPWKCRCKRCNKIVFPKYSDIRNGDGGCKYCGGHYVDPKFAFNFMVSMGVIPQEPYSHNAKKWPCICKTCGRNVSPTWNSVQSGNSACGFCARRKVDPKEAEASMIKRGAIPLVPYPGARTPWKSLCLKCERQITPDYSSVVNQLQNPCGFCAGKRVDAKSAYSLMLAAGLTPLEDYEKAKKPWRCVCNKCNKLVTPTYTSIRIGQGGCRYCTNKGIDYSEPAYLYLMLNVRLNAYKLGIANHKTRNNRVGEHKKYGWEVIKTLDFIDGDSAYQVEQEVILWIRKDLTLPIYLSKDQMPQGGYTETFDATEIDPVTIWRKVEELVKVKK